jgi:hypothetical protein
LAFAESTSAPTRADILAAAGGALRELEIAEAPRGVDAATLLLGTNALERGLGIRLEGAAYDREELIARFRSEVPGGQLLELDRSPARVHRCTLSPQARRCVLRELASRSAGRHPRAVRDAAVDIAVLSPRGEARVLFIAPRKAAGFMAFRLEVERSSVLLSLPAALHPRRG